jgi:hypothetical protein
VNIFLGDQEVERLLGLFGAMSSIFTVRFACLATAISLAALTALTLAAAAGSRPLAPAVHTFPAASAASPLRTPSPEARSMATAMSTSGDLLPSGLSLPGVIAVLAVAALMGGVSVMVSRGVGATRRVLGQQFTVGKAFQSPSAGGPVQRTALSPLSALRSESRQGTTPANIAGFRWYNHGARATGLYDLCKGRGLRRRP